MTTRVVAIIPARMASSRFPGKPLIKIHGLPMIEHVRRRVVMSNIFSDVVVATCDKEIEEATKSYGGRVIMTSPDHPGATDRVAEAAESLDCTHVINVQGDEILILPDDLKTMVNAINAAPNELAWNAVAPIQEKSELSDPSIVKCAVTQSNRIQFCLRDFSNIPFKDSFEPINIVLGILGYKKEFLKQVGKLERTPGEMLGNIDQNRIIEHNIQLNGVVFKKGYPGINEEREVKIVEDYLATDPDQVAVLESICGEATARSQMP